MRTRTLTKYIAGSSMALSVVGCIATTPEGTSESEQVASTQDELLIGATCETAPWDVMFSYNGSNPAGETSPDTYDHTGCRHTWILDGQYTAPGSVVVSYEGPQLSDDSVFPCNSEWITVEVLLMPVGAVVAGPMTIQGTTTSAHSCILPSWRKQLNRGTYRILVSAGFINASYEPVAVSWGF